MSNDPVIDWLLDADPSIRWQVMRDLTDTPGSFWWSNLYTLLFLRDLGSVSIDLAYTRANHAAEA